MNARSMCDSFCRGAVGLVRVYDPATMSVTAILQQFHSVREFHEAHN